MWWEGLCLGANSGVSLFLWHPMPTRRSSGGPVADCLDHRSASTINDDDYSHGVFTFTLYASPNLPPTSTFFAKGKKTPIMHMVKELQFQRQGCDLRRKKISGSSGKEGGGSWNLNLGYLVSVSVLGYNAVTLALLLISVQYGYYFLVFKSFHCLYSTKTKKSRLSFAIETARQNGIDWRGRRGGAPAK